MLPPRRISGSTPATRLGWLAVGLWLLAGLTAGLPGAHAQAVPATPAVPARAVLISPPSVFVQFNNHILFPLYTNGDQTAQDRADLANLRLADSLRVSSVGGGAGQVPTVTVGTRDAQTVLLLDGKLVLTVTQADAGHAGQPPAQLAQSWADTLNRAFRQALRERQPSYLRWAFKNAALTLAAALVVNVLLRLGVRRLGHRLGWPVQALLWLVAALHVIVLFPQTRPLNILLITGPLRPLTLCLASGLPAAVLVRLWAVILRRLFPPIPEDLSAQDRTERTFQRRATLGRVAEVTGATVIWAAAVITGVSWYGLNLSALLTSAGLIGVALSFAAQDAMRDLVASLYILADDRFGVGDTIQVGAYQGRVERLNLRATQIRDLSGRLITVSNRSIVDVANLTARWAQVDFQIGVSYYDDVDRASALLLETAQALAEEWHDRVLAPPELLGVDSFTEVNVTLRLTLRTPPGDQWAVARELRRRVKHAFDAAGIAVLNSLYTPPPAPPRGPAGPKSD